MEFNNRRERLKFEKEWMVLEEQCLAVGIKVEALVELREKEWLAYKKDRNFKRVMQYFPEEEYLDGSHPLEVKFPEKFCCEDNYFQTGRYDWVETIEDSVLLDKIELLTLKQLDILTQYVFEERNQAEIAKDLGVSQAAVSQQINTIIKKLK